MVTNNKKVELDLSQIEYYNNCIKNYYANICPNIELQIYIGRNNFHVSNYSWYKTQSKSNFRPAYYQILINLLYLLLYLVQSVFYQSLY